MPKCNFVLSHASSRWEFCEPNCFRGEQLVKNNVPVHPFKDDKQDSQEEAKSREKWCSQVKRNLEKALLLMEQEHETVHLTMYKNRHVLCYQD